MASLAEGIATGASRAVEAAQKAASDINNALKSVNPGASGPNPVRTPSQNDPRGRLGPMPSVPAGPIPATPSLKRSASLVAPRGTTDQSVTHHIAVNVQGGSGDTGKQIGDRVADRLANMKNLYFTSAGPVSA
jgi:hypothetical protein